MTELRLRFSFLVEAWCSDDFAGCTECLFGFKFLLEDCWLSVVWLVYKIGGNSKPFVESNAIRRFRTLFMRLASGDGFFDFAIGCNC